MPIFSPRMQIELQARIRKEVSSQNGDVISNFKWKCIEKYGVNGLKELNSLFKQIDTSGDGTIQQDEFKRAIDRMGLRYSKNDLMILFNAFDVDGSGSISIEEFMNYLLSGLISDSRKKTVKDLFKKLDSDSSGALEVNELKNKIDFTKNGHYNSGKWSEDDCVQEFFSAFGQSNKSITYSEFLAFYAAISSCISDDAHFKLAMQKFWKSTYVESGSERRRVWPQSNSGCISLKSTQPRFVNNRFARTSSDLNTTKMSPILSSKEAVRSKSAGGGKRRTCYRSLPTYCDNSLFGDSRACRLMESDWPDFKSPFSEENKHSVHNDRPPSINNFRKSDGCKESLATHKVDIGTDKVLIYEIR